MSDTTNKILAAAKIGIGLLAGYLALKTLRAMAKERCAQVADLSRSPKSYSGKNKLLNYIVDETLRLHPTQEKLQKASLLHTRAVMLGAPDQLQFLGHLARLIGAKKALDIGTFTGYSALSIALVLPSDGRLVTCDVTDEYARIGQPFWKEAGVDNIIDFKVAPAAETLKSLLSQGEEGSYDFAFIDADKPGYCEYYELCLKLLRPGGIIALDNLLWSGLVADEGVTDADTEALRAACRKAASDPRVTFSLLNVGDGTGIAVKL